MSAAPPGWYVDPEDPTQQRFWDGTAWTNHRAPGSVAPLGLGASSSPGIARGATSPSARPAAVEPLAAAASTRQRLQLEVDALQRQRAAEEAALAEARQLRARESNQFQQQAAAERRTIQADLDRWRAQVVAVSDEAILQEVGIYNYRHPLASAVAYKAHIERIQAQLKSMARTDRALVSSTTWTVGGSATQGRAMVHDISKLMLRAYNNEADDLVRTMKPYKLEAATARLDKAANTISRLGKVLGIAVESEYHRLRWQELELTADFLAKKAEEKERERDEKARLREEETARREFEAEKARLAKEAAHYAAALVALQAKGDIVKAEEIQARLSEIQTAISGVEARAANIESDTFMSSPT